jgi:hypothetical protein
MKSISVFLIFVLIISSCSPKSKSKNDLFYDQIQGKVSKLTMTFYNAVEKSGKIVKDTAEEKYIFHFNRDGNITEQVEISIQDTRSKIVDRSIFIYNEKGLKVSAKHSENSKPYLTYTYDENGGLKDIISIDENKGTLLKKTKLTFKTDRSGSEYDEYLPNGKLDTKTTYKSNNDLVNEIRQYNSNGKLVGQFNFIYDVNGRLERRKDSSESTISETSFKYSDIDKKGNYLTSVSYFKGKPYQIEERILEYY